MILPPFFGLLNKYQETDIQKIIHTYLTTDIATYTIPTPIINISYITTDLLSYTKLTPSVSVSYNTLDILSYHKLSATDISYISYVVCDVLCYELPPSVPSGFEFVYFREKDSLGIINWIPPYNGKSPIIDYIIEYKPTGDTIWTLFNDGINTNTGVNITLSNNESYELKLTAVNNVGTGISTITGIISPSGGVDIDCELIFYADLDQSDRNQLTDYSCSPKDIFVVTNNVSFDNGDGAYNNSWYFDGQFDTTDIPETYPHIRVTKCCNQDWSLYSNFTISLWVKPVSVIGTYATMLSASSVNNYWKISHYDDNVYFSTNGIEIVATGALQNNTYTNIVVCRSKNYISMFIDGIETNEVYFSNIINIDSDFMLIGAFAYDNYLLNNSNGRGYTVEGFQGNIDEIIFSRSCLYRGNFIPTSRNKILDCSLCTTLDAPTNLTVTYLED